MTTGFGRPAAACNCGSRTAGGFLFFARAKKRNQKKARPLVSAPCQQPARGSLAPPSPQGVHIRDIPVADAHARASRPRPRGPALRPRAALGLIKGVLKNTGWRYALWPNWALGVFELPVAAAEHRSRNRGIREPSDRARGALFSARRVRRAPIPARRAGGSRRLRGVFSFGDFSLDKQRKVTCRGSATHKYASPQATQNQPEIARNARDTIQSLDSRFRGNDDYVARSEPPAISISNRARSARSMN